MHLIDFCVVSLEVAIQTQWTSVFPKMYVSVFVLAIVVRKFICSSCIIITRMRSVTLPMVMLNYLIFSHSVIYF